MKQVSAVSKIKKFTGTIRNNRTNNSRPVQTMIIHDESVSLAIPLLLSKLSDEKSHLAHVLTFGSDKTPVVQKLQQLLQILNRNEMLRILYLNGGEIEDREIESFAETLTRLLSRLHFSYDLLVVRLMPERRMNNTAIKHKIHDIDANESHEFISSRIARLFQSDGFPMDEQLQEDGVENHSEDLHSLEYVDTVAFRPQTHETQEIQVEGEDWKSESIGDVYEFIIVLIILFFLLNFLFHLLRNCYLIFK